MNKTADKIINCIISPIPAAIKVAVWIICITVPVAFMVFLLKYTGAINSIAGLFSPVFSLLGLPGESALVFITSCLLNIYSCIAVIGTLDLTGHEITVLALMCLISHNLPVECAVQKKTGTPVLALLAVRLGASFAGGAALNMLLPADTGVKSLINGVHQSSSGKFMTDASAWLASTAWLCGKIFVLIVLLMILQKILEQFRITILLASIMKYPLGILGIPKNAAFLWIVSNTLGLAYGSGILIDHAGKGSMSQRELNLFNYHIAVSHSLLEDTLLFVAIGVSAWWITFPRILLAGIVVWGARLIYFMLKNGIQTAEES